eukprot:GFUD01023738.1.p1 GENE.GFUD01023738.1~~GFUD01023738.1.p1  ORF type:complete len:527 (-),score=144.44 GFUD01023738.1:21-1601(-)
MPRRKGPASLRAITLKQICDNFELICYGVPRRSPGFRQFIKHGKYLSVRSPLKQLPVHVLSELVQVVLDQLGTSPHILHAVIQPQLTSCRLPSVVSTLPLAIKLLVERTQRLYSFELTCCKSISPLVLAALVPYLQNLTFLNVEGTNFDDFGLEQLGTHVEGLLTLNVARTRVTDVGVQSLENKLPELAFCILLSNRINPREVVRFMVNHSFLLTLEYENMREVLSMLAHDETRQMGQMNLRKIVLENCREDMDQVFRRCISFLPLLEAVSLNNSDLSVSLLNNLSHFQHLEKLELGNSMSTQYTASFMESVVPVLEIIGTQLTHLSLENFKFFDVTNVGKLCPKLVNLKLSNILSYCRTENQRQKVFRNLEELYIFNTRWGNITEGMLRQLLNSTKLRIINLQFVNSLTDKLFQAILTLNHFPDLEFVTFEQCHRFSADLLLSLLTVPPLLSSLHCWSCGNINSGVRSEVERFIEERNLDINFQWQDVPEENIANLDILNEDDENDDLQNLLLPLIGVNILPNID